MSVADCFFFFLASLSSPDWFIKSKMLMTETVIKMLPLSQGKPVPVLLLVHICASVFVGDFSQQLTCVYDGFISLVLLSFQGADSPAD